MSLVLVNYASCYDRNATPTTIYHCVASPAVSRIGLVKPEKVQMVENLCLQMAQRGQLTEKVEILQQVEAVALNKKKNGPQIGFCNAAGVRGETDTAVGPGERTDCYEKQSYSAAAATSLG